jgi:hypothetical protein
MLRYILIGFALYFLYRFIFELVIPVYRTTKQVKKQFDSVKQQHAQNNTHQRNTEKPSSHKSSINKDDYIDFEEL